MTIRFPKRRADGSFDLLLNLRVGAAGSRLATWLPAWVERNGTWERHWESAGKTETEALRFADDFSAPPTLEQRGEGTIAIRFRVRPTAQLWRDWSAKLYDDLRKECGDDVELAGAESVAD